MQEAGNRHVVEADQPIKRHALLGQTPAPGRRITGGELLQGRARRVAHQGEQPPRIVLAVAELVEPAQRFERGDPGALAPLGVRAVGLGGRQAGDDLHLVVRQEGGQVGQGRQQQHGQVAAVDHVAPQPAGLQHQPPEGTVQFRGAAGEIHHLGPQPPDRLQALVHHGLGHLAGPLVGSGIHMAVAALHVAEAPQVELQHPQGRAPGRGQLPLGQGGAKAPLRAPAVVQQLALLLGCQGPGPPLGGGRGGRNVGGHREKGAASSAMQANGNRGAPRRPGSSWPSRRH